MLSHFSSINPTAPTGSAEKSLRYTQPDTGLRAESSGDQGSLSTLSRPTGTPRWSALRSAEYPTLLSSGDSTTRRGEYPDLINFNESTNFRIKKLMDDEKLLQDEIKFRTALSKKYGRYAAVADVLEWTLIAGDIVVGTMCAAIPGIGSTISTITFSGVGAISGFSKIVQAKLTSKKTKHRDLSIVAKTTLDNLHHKISKAIADGQITHDEFEDIQSTVNMWKKARSGELAGSIREPLLTPEMIQTLTANAQKELIARLQKSDSILPTGDRRRETMPPRQ